MKLYRGGCSSRIKGRRIFFFLRYYFLISLTLYENEIKLVQKEWSITLSTFPVFISTFYDLIECTTSNWKYSLSCPLHSIL